jgi:hypothetical protein
MKLRSKNQESEQLQGAGRPSDLQKHRRTGRRREEETIPSLRARYCARNVHIARIVLANPDAHGGNDAALVRWARAVIASTAGRKSDGSDGYPQC